jgi:hypothetical protein
MLDSQTIKKIEDLVYSKPRSIQEIAQHIKKNWRTADRYIQEIKNQFGTLDFRIFREGTRGALKIVYWASIEKISHSIFQEQLEELIMKGRGKADFSAFDIFQHIKDKSKKAWIRTGPDEASLGRLNIFQDLLLSAKKQVIFFSGNLSFINYKHENINLFNTMEELVKKNIKIKVICRVDLTGKENIEKLLSLNFKHKKELIEVRHREQPLRATIVDNQYINLKEVKEPTGRIKELNKKIFIFYDINNKDWAEWMSKIFWKMFNSSIDSNRRLEELNKII